MRTDRKPIISEARKTPRITDTCQTQTCRLFKLTRSTAHYKIVEISDTALQAYVDNITNLMPEIPSKTRTRLLSLGLSERDVDFLMSVDASREIGFDGTLVPGAVALFDQISIRHDPKTALNWFVWSLIYRRTYR